MVRQSAFALRHPLRAIFLLLQVDAFTHAAVSNRILCCGVVSSLGRGLRWCLAQATLPALAHVFGMISFWPSVFLTAVNAPLIAVYMRLYFAPHSNKFTNLAFGGGVLYLIVVMAALSWYVKNNVQYLQEHRDSCSFQPAPRSTTDTHVTHSADHSHHPHRPCPYSLRTSAAPFACPVAHAADKLKSSAADAAAVVKTAAPLVTPPSQQS